MRKWGAAAGRGWRAEGQGASSSEELDKTTRAPFEAEVENNMQTGTEAHSGGKEGNWVWKRTAG